MFIQSDVMSNFSKIEAPELHQIMKHEVILMAISAKSET